jgi:hypothetical protein
VRLIHDVFYMNVSLVSADRAGTVPVKLLFERSLQREIDACQRDYMYASLVSADRLGMVPVSASLAIELKN